MPRVTLTQRVNEMSSEMAALTKTVNENRLNGYKEPVVELAKVAPALVSLAVAAPALVKLAEAAPDLITRVQKAHENEEFWRVFRKKIGWSKTRVLLWAAVTALLGSFAYWIFNTPH